MEKHAIPQNIMDVEFKLFGELTVRQFGYIAGGGFAALFFWFVFSNLPLLRYILVFLSVILGVALALVKINNQPFETWLTSYITALFGSQKRVWRKIPTPPKYLQDSSVDIKSYTVSEAQTKNIETPQQSGARTDFMPHEVAQTNPLSRGNNTSDASNSSSSNNQPMQQTTNQNQQSNTLASDANPYDENIHAIPTGVQSTTPLKMQMNQSPSRPIQPPQQPAQQAKQPTQPVQMQPQQPAPGPPPPPQPEPEPVEPQPMPPQRSDSEPIKDQEGEIQIDDFSVTLPAQEESEPEEAQVEQVLDETETDLSPKAQHNAEVDEDIVPPARPFDIQAGMDAAPEEDPLEKLQTENKELREKIADYSSNVNNLKGDVSDAKKQFEEANSQNNQLSEQIRMMQGEIEKLKSENQQAAPFSPAPHPQPETPPQNMAEAVVQPDQAPAYEEIIQQVAAENPPVPLAPVEATLSTSAVVPHQIRQAVAYNGPSLSKKPNVISGVVKDREGKLLSDVIAIIKRKDTNRAVSANKTNTLGQFVSTNAMDDGEYVISLTKADHSFDSYSVILNGQLVPTFEFNAQ